MTALDPSYTGAGVNLSEENLKATLTTTGVVRLVFADTPRTKDELGKAWAFDAFFYNAHTTGPLVGIGIALAAARSDLTVTLDGNADAIMYYSDGTFWDGPNTSSSTIATWPLDNGTHQYIGFQLSAGAFVSFWARNEGLGSNVYASGGPWYPVVELRAASGAVTDCEARFAQTTLWQESLFGNVAWDYLIPLLTFDNRTRRVITKYTPIRQLRI